MKVVETDYFWRLLRDPLPGDVVGEAVLLSEQETWRGLELVSPASHVLAVATICDLKSLLDQMELLNQVDPDCDPTIYTADSYESYVAVVMTRNEAVSHAVVYGDFERLFWYELTAPPSVNLRNSNEMYPYVEALFRSAEESILRVWSDVLQMRYSSNDLTYSWKRSR